jgi:hypothetical protein
MIRLLFTVFLLTTFTACELKIQSIDKDKERINNVCDQFMQMFVDGKIHDAMQILKRNSVMTSGTIDTLEVTINNQATNYFKGYGKITSSEFITERKIKDFISKRFYILKFDRYYLRFDFTLYKSNEGWTVTSFKYDDELIELLN